MASFVQGRFKPRNPSKYKGNPTEIFYRSSWELHVMTKFDNSSDVVWWSSEEKAIPYRSPVDRRIHRYFVDFIVCVKEPSTPSGKKVYVIEVKPHAQTKPPKNRKTKKFIREAVTYAVNEAKWQAARAWCQERGYEFMIITEKDLGSLFGG